MKRIGGSMAAVSVDEPSDSRRVVEGKHLPFPILADVDRSILDAYGLRHAGAGPKGSDVAIPAYVLIDRDGRIVWRRVSRRIPDRPDPEEVIAEIKSRFNGAPVRSPT